MSVSNIPGKVEQSTASHHRQREGLLQRYAARNIQDMKSLDMWRACFAEFLGMMLLSFFCISVGISKDGEEPASLLQIGLGVGFFLTLMITSLTTVSGGHVNPAITLGFLVTNQVTFIRFIFYVIFQSLGAIVGTAILKAVLPPEYQGSMGLIQPGSGVSDGQALGMEIAMGVLLLFGTISYVDKHRDDIQGSIPLVVGFIVAINILAGGKISGGAMNPARALGSAVITGNSNKQWIYWLGPMTGGAFGALLYQLIFSTRPIGVIRRTLQRQERSNNYTHPDSLRLDNGEEMTGVHKPNKLPDQMFDSAES